MPDGQPDQDKPFLLMVSLVHRLWPQIHVPTKAELFSFSFVFFMPPILGNIVVSLRSGCI